uniref:NADH-ubiquinone oxidoreductase chain 2 n=1 Tax=Limnichidae sp. MJTNT-2012 TaxID=1131603 RepID=H6W8J3_9COLE|nr:NADH dehydrogenase subunit 2 [Limnichidae sp. MJTNT-2012]
MKVLVLFFSVKNLYKILFLTSLMAGTFISVSSTSWMGMWIGLEINLLSIIPLMSSKNNIMSNEASLKYFITQAMASTLLLFAVLIMMISSFFNNFISANELSSMILNTSLLTKIGAAPFHFWFPEVMEGLQWTNCFILLTWQKFAPMVLLMYNVNSLMFISIIIIISMLISGIMGINQSSLRKIMAYSSINHIAWMLSSLMFMEKIWVYYFVIYSFITINLLLIFNLYKTFFINQLFNSMKTNTLMKILFSMNFMSMGGLPPFLGFFPKWLTIQVMINNEMFILTFLMTIMTLLTLYFYMRLAFSAFLLHSNENNFEINIAASINSNKFIMVMNLIQLTSLLVCPILFNIL